MKCHLCKQTIFEETTWNNLFQRTIICMDCQSVLEDPVTYERIPISEGYIDLCQIYPVKKPTIDLSYLFHEKYRFPIQEVLKTPNKYNVILFLDDSEQKYIDLILPYILPFKRILFMSESSRFMIE